jgi:hypothetical protein
MAILRRIGVLAIAAIIGMVVCATLLPGTASAHERRDLANGKYQAVVGFLAEPAYSGQINGLDLTVTSKTDLNADGTGKPVTGLEKTLKAQVIKDGKTLDLTVQSRFNMPGKYAAYFEPTSSGQYVYHIYGQINGDTIDERFESGPGRFGDVEDIAPLQFPVAAPQAPADLQAQLDSAKSAASTARIVGIVGIVVGIVGIAVGAFALMRRPATDSTAGRMSTTPSEGDD